MNKEGRREEKYLQHQGPNKKNMSLLRFLYPILSSFNCQWLSLHITKRKKEETFLSHLFLIQFTGYVYAFVIEEP